LFLAINKSAHLLIRLCLQISESFRRFGISDSTTSLLVIKVSTSPSITHESVAKHLGPVVKGTPVEFSNKTLSEIADLARIKKIYKFNAGQSASPAKRDDVEGNGVDDAGTSGRKELEIAIMGAIALRGAS
jgi:EKC/KEOPS complex subunit CGI121/TPRKB